MGPIVPGRLSAIECSVGLDNYQRVQADRTSIDYSTASSRNLSAAGLGPGVAESSFPPSVGSDRWMPLCVPQGKKRRALLRKLKETFRRFRSQPVSKVIEQINPILRGWVNYARDWKLQSVLLVRPTLGGKEDSATPGPSPAALRFRLEAVE